jgi:hypothetical protein
MTTKYTKTGETCIKCNSEIVRAWVKNCEVDDYEDTCDCDWPQPDPQELEDQKYFEDEHFGGDR